MLITGASSGIGAVCALGLDAKGWQVFAGVRTAKDGEVLAEASSGRLRPVLLDVTDPAQITGVAATVAEHVGEHGLDALINNAGIVVAGPLEFVPMADFRSQFEVNLMGPLAVTQAMLCLLRLARGRVLLISSVSARVALPFVGPYAASKAALEAIADSLRLELRPHGVAVAIIQPGPIDTAIMDRSIRAAEERFDGASPAVSAFYGPMLAAARASAIETTVNAKPPEAVLAAVIHALTARRCRTRYIVLRGGWLFRLATNLLPDRLRDALILRILARHHPR